MQKHKENHFFEKFSSLNSQEHNEDIKWSSSSSSDYENITCNDRLQNIADKTRNKKRKRKKKVPKNISNLDITIVDTCNDHKKVLSREKSPILVPKYVASPVSPILTSTKFPRKIVVSPILSHRKLHQKSPILMPKSASPKYAVKVRKKLAYNEEKCFQNNSCDPITETILRSNFNRPDKAVGSVSLSQDSRNAGKKIKSEEIKGNFVNLEVSNTDGKSEIVNSIKSSDNSASPLEAKLSLMKKVKNYFDSHFSSENTSQNISDTPTPEECRNEMKCEPVDILSCRTQSVSSIQPLKHDSTSNSDTTIYFEKNKKVKYKKGGLAYRLNVLLKKQTAHISLWQHERFLAGTSNFVIPKGEHVVFCIQKIDFKYGSYLLDAVDVNNEKYVLSINSLYVNNNLSVESVFKLYEPYRILDLDKDYKIVINVCKFECIDLKFLNN